MSWGHKFWVQDESGNKFSKNLIFFTAFFRWHFACHHRKADAAHTTGYGERPRRSHVTIVEGKSVGAFLAFVCVSYEARAWEAVLDTCSANAQGSCAERRCVNTAYVIFLTATPCRLLRRRANVSVSVMRFVPMRTSPCLASSRNWILSERSECAGLFAPTWTIARKYRWIITNLLTTKIFYSGS